MVAIALVAAENVRSIRSVAEHVTVCDDDFHQESAHVVAHCFLEHVANSAKKSHHHSVTLRRQVLVEKHTECCVSAKFHP